MVLMITALPWICAVLLLGCAAIAATAGIAVQGKRRGAARSATVAALAETCLALAILGAAGVAAPATVVILCVLLAGIATVMVLTDKRVLPPDYDGPHWAAVVSDAWAAAFLTVRDVLRDVCGRASRVRGGRGDRPAAVPASLPRRTIPPPGPAPSIPGRRAVPPVRRDPALASAPLSRSITSGPVSPAWQALIASVADFDPEDEDVFLEHWREQATGFLAYADAMLDAADALGDGGAGLAPPIISAVFDGAEAVGDCAGDFAAIRQRYLSVYAGAREDVAAGNALPKDGRFVTGESEEAA